MSHLFESGVTYGEKSWHKLENNLSADDGRRYSVDGTLAASGMDWQVAKFPLAIAGGHGELSGTDATGCYGVFRTDRWECLAAVGEDYRCLQNVDIFKQFQPFLDCRALSFETAGAIDGGKRVFVQARLAQDDTDIGGGDKIKPMLLIASSHDGSLATRVGFTPIRVVCNNTLTAAVSRGGLLRVKHTRSQHDALDAIMETVDLARQQFAATCEQYARLQRCGISERDLQAYVKRVLGIKDDDKPSTRTRNQFDKIIRCALYGKGNSRSELTAWSAFNGVTEWTSHYRQSSADARRKSVWFGASATTNAKALDLALELAS